MTTQKHKTPGFYRYHPILDPDFDDLGSELTLAQWRNPVLTLGDMWNPVHPMGGDPVGFIQRQRDRKVAKIYRQQRQLQDLGMRLRKAQNLHLRRAKERLRRRGARLHQLMDWQMRRRGPQWNWLPKIEKWMTTRQRQILASRRKQLSVLSQRFLAAQLKSYPKFNFGNWWIYKCKECVPYNGHHTPNYWATGQADCW
jgi:hypothetical protein